MSHSSALASPPLLNDQLPQRKPVLATMPGPDPLWNTYVYDHLPANAGSFKDYLALLKLAKGRETLILNGSVGRRQKYRDLIFAILLKLTFMNLGDAPDDERNSKVEVPG